MLPLATSLERRDWYRQVLLVAAVLIATVVLEDWVGLAGFALLFALLRRKLGVVEALIGVFLIVVALASSRLGYHQYAKSLRLPLLLLLGFHGIRRFNTWPRQHRLAHVRWALLVFLGVALPTVINQGLAISDPSIALLPGAWFIYGLLAFHATPAELTRRFDLFAILAPAAYLSLFAFEALRGQEALLVGRFRGWLGNPNELSHWWLPAVAVLFVGIGGMARRRWAAFLAFGTVYLYLQTGSRSPLALFLSVLFGAYLMNAALSRRLQLLTGLAITAGVLAFPFLNSDLLSGILPESVLRSESIEAGGGRFVAWQFGWEELLRRPWWGGGAGYEEVYYDRHGDMLSLLGHQGLSHNSYLAFALNFGIPIAGLLLVGFYRKLGLLRPGVLFLGTLPFLLATFVEGVLTSPLNAVTPMWFFAAAWMAQKRQASAHDPAPGVGRR